MPEDAVLRSPNDITQQTICTVQDTLTNDCFRQTIPPPPRPARGRGE